MRLGCSRRLICTCFGFVYVAASSCLLLLLLFSVFQSSVVISCDIWHSHSNIGCTLALSRSHASRTHYKCKRAHCCFALCLPTLGAWACMCVSVVFWLASASYCLLLTFCCCCCCFFFFRWYFDFLYWKPPPIYIACWCLFSFDLPFATLYCSIRVKRWENMHSMPVAISPWWKLGLCAGFASAYKTRLQPLF